MDIGAVDIAGCGHRRAWTSPGVHATGGEDMDLMRKRTISVMSAEVGGPSPALHSPAVHRAVAVTRGA